MKRENETCIFRLPSDALNYDRELVDRAEESVEKKSLLPILKDELRCKIQTKRLSQGLEELKVDFDVKPPQPLTPDEVKKVEHRKSINRRAAKDCRERKKQIHSLREQELKILREKNEILRQKIRCIEAEKDFYMTNILKHPEISKVVADFFTSLNNSASDHKREIIYQQN